MYEYLLAWPGSHFDAVRDPWHSWVEGSAYDASLSPGYIEQFDDGTYPWLTGTQVIGFTWFEHAANLAITDSLALSTPEIGRHFKRLWIR